MADEARPGSRTRLAQWLVVRLALTALGLSACSSDDPDDRGADVGAGRDDAGPGSDDVGPGGGCGSPAGQPCRR